MVLWVCHRGLDFLSRLVPRGDSECLFRADVHGGDVAVSRHDMVEPLGLGPPRGEEGSSSANVLRCVVGPLV